MWLLQLSAGRGPEECERAVGLALKQLQHEAQQQQLGCKLLEQQSGRRAGCFKSVLVQLAGDNANALSQHWQGPMLWVCASPYRPKHKRKNWFFSGESFELSSSETEPRRVDDDIEYRSCRASGAGGQHVNTTDSAVQARHKATGLQVRVESERSQHANKKLARCLLLHKLKQQADEEQRQQQQQRWQQHLQLTRGNAQRRFVGTGFIEET